MGISLFILKQTVIVPLDMAVSATAAVSPGMLVTLWRKVMSLQHQPHLQRQQRIFIIPGDTALKGYYLSDAITED